MNKAVYSKPNLMQNVKESKRYIDGGAGFYTGSERSFKTWMNSVNNALQPYALLIDEYTIKDIDEFAPFLDILFCFEFEHFSTLSAPLKRLSTFRLGRVHLST